MNFRPFLLLSTLIVSQAGLLSANDSHIKNVPGQSVNFRVDDKTEVPDGSLKPGPYTIRVVDHLSDRMIVEIKSTDGKVKQTFLGVPSKDPASATGPVYFTGSKSKAALRGFSFAAGTGVDFVYPKNSAVALAKANGTSVLAVDPASEGMPASTGLSPDDMKMITLWMLTPTAVGPGDASGGIAAAKYKAPAATNSLSAEAKPPVVHRLPKTASLLPLLNLIAVGFLSLGTGLGIYRIRSAA